MGFCAASQGKRIKPLWCLLLGSVETKVIVATAASPESGCAPEPAEELPGPTETVRVLRVCPEATEGIPEGQETVFQLLYLKEAELTSCSSLFQVNMLVIELKSEALKDRHWKQLMKRLHVNWVLSELTLGQIWDVDLQKNEMVVKDVLLVAQGEMALEEFLKQVRRLDKTQI